MKYLSIVLLAIGFLFAQTPVFRPAEYVYANSTPIDVEYYGSPFFYDWDGDGVRDLLTGQFHYGRVRFYKNVGTNEAPQFNTYEFLQADGSYIQVTYG